MRILGTMLFFVFFLSSCSLFQTNTEDNRLAVCKELKHRMMFNGATSNQALATQERAEWNKLSQAYKDQGCE